MPTIEQLQKLLVKLGHDISVDGFWGPETEAALKEEIGEPSVGQASPDSSEDTNGAADYKHLAGGAVKYLQPDGYLHIPRGDNPRLSAHLEAREVHCQGRGCCRESVINPAMVDAFEDVRAAYGLPILISTAGGSGFRCPVHNADPNVGGVAGSLHLSGSAFDLHPAPGGSLNKLASAVAGVIKDGEIGIYRKSNFIHAGVWHRGFINRYNGN